MRKQIAAANWKMNLTRTEAIALTDSLLTLAPASMSAGREVLLAVPFPYLSLVGEKLQGRDGFHVAAQNCYQKEKGAYTGEVSAAMLSSMGIGHVLIGHSERREYFSESNGQLAEKVDRALAHGIRPVFCCGEPDSVREAGNQTGHVETQLRESLFHLSAEQLKGFVIAYEPIWAIGTGKTATSDQAQEMHASIRKVFATHYGDTLADTLSVLYGGSVKASNAQELFSRPDVDGGLVGGASLDPAEFSAIIRALK
jgi:triosephosphate isomerase